MNWINNRSNMKIKFLICRHKLRICPLCFRNCKTIWINPRNHQKWGLNNKILSTQDPIQWLTKQGIFKIPTISNRMKWSLYEDIILAYKINIRTLWTCPFNKVLNFKQDQVLNHNTVHIRIKFKLTWRNSNHIWSVKRTSMAS